jgi:response regulator RpfG family c-di-GMP phosphodiesterase
MAISSHYLSENDRWKTFHINPPSRSAHAADSSRQSIAMVCSKQSDPIDLPLGTLPTVLVAAHEELRESVVLTLKTDGYLVMEAANEAEALHLVISQTRSIHILLVDLEMNGRKLAEDLNPYRPEMRVLFIALHSLNSSETFNAGAAMAKIREYLEVPESVRKQMSGNSARVMRMIA